MTLSSVVSHHLCVRAQIGLFLIGGCLGVGTSLISAASAKRWTQFDLVSPASGVTHWGCSAKVELMKSRSAWRMLSLELWTRPQKLRSFLSCFFCFVAAACLAVNLRGPCALRTMTDKAACAAGHGRAGTERRRPGTTYIHRPRTLNTKSYTQNPIPIDLAT